MSERTPQEEEKGLEEESLNGGCTLEEPSPETISIEDLEDADEICEAVCELMEIWHDSSDIGRLLAIRKLKEAGTGSADTSMIRMALLAAHRRSEEPDADEPEDLDPFDGLNEEDIE